MQDDRFRETVSIKDSDSERVSEREHQFREKDESEKDSIREDRIKETFPERQIQRNSIRQTVSRERERMSKRDSIRERERVSERVNFRERQFQRETVLERDRIR